jgi:hypothetical protein
MLKYLTFLFLIPFLTNVLSMDYQQNLEEANTVFKNMQVEGKNGDYTVKGEASTKEGKFYYTVEDGHNQYVEETPVTLEKKFPEQSPFEIKISIPKDDLPQNATLILNLYERSKEGNIINNFPVVLEQIYK